MKLSLRPNGHIARTRAHSYIVELPNGASAILDTVGGNGWHLTIRESGKISDGGWFATTDEALAFLDSAFPRHVR